MFQEREIGRYVWTEIQEDVMRERIARYTNPMAGMTVDYFVAQMMAGDTQRLGYSDYRWWEPGRVGNPYI